MKDLFDVCRFSDLVLQSRIIRTGLWESENQENKQLTPEVLKRYEKIASSGVGIITTELISIYPNDGFSPYSHSINSPTFINDFSEVVHTCHMYDTPVFAQIGFIRYGNGDNQNLAPHELTLEDIRRIQADLLVSCKKISFAGFDGVQINMGNYYFLSRFISPTFNGRNDKYGGNTQNRVRIATELVKLIKANFDLHVSCRVNVIDDDGIEICKLLESAGADSIQITKPRSPQYFTRDNKNNDLLELADKAAGQLKIPVILGGGFSNQNKLNEILNRTNIEFFSMQRPFVADPYFLLDWRVDGNGISRCKTCNNCYWKKTSDCFIFKPRH
ncbi:NADH-dependent flavin oxidoreductase [Methanobrevibacter sp.]|uniref:oxidoreductase n=1 Tax=Methanobrevibacter sp. TaxID=66852 RepID=UPI0026DFB332|nr:NADH-dependent flavin oxidoreductase [Methanobrevibacter sp.]MDO5859170.1 NADH-dependent flavin oxidoreductase [Methanobrevibacter sp.]